MPRKNIVVSGRVQGVGFRYFTIGEAQRYEITGWVRNCRDGTVQIEAQAGGPNLGFFIESVREGPSYSAVSSLDVSPLAEVEGEKTFELKW